jgi:hypothetical protein
MTEVTEQTASQAKAPQKKTPLALMALMGLNILLGIGVAVAGHWLLEIDGVALAGGVLATIAALLILCFQLWGSKN